MSDNTGIDIIDASIIGDLERVKVLIKENPNHVYSKDEFGRNALMFASNRGHLEIIREILEVDKELINCRDSMDDTPLLYATAYCRSLVVKELLKEGSDHTIHSQWRNKHDSLNLAKYALEHYINTKEEIRGYKM